MINCQINDPDSNCISSKRDIPANKIITCKTPHKARLKPQSDGDFSLTSYCEYITVVDRNSSVPLECGQDLWCASNLQIMTKMMGRHFCDCVILQKTPYCSLTHLLMEASCHAMRAYRESHMTSSLELRVASNPHSILQQIKTPLVNLEADPWPVKTPDGNWALVNTWVAALQWAQLTHRSYPI